MSEEETPLGLLHPDGCARRVLLLGSGCPERLRPAAGAAAPPCDLIVVAPSPAEARDPGWRAGALGRVAEALDPDGLVYLLAAPGARSALTAAMRRAGLERAEWVLHLPDPSLSVMLLPLRGRALRESASRLLRGGARGLGARFAMGLPGAVLGRWHPSVAVVLRRPGARPLAAWAGSRGPGLDRLAALRTRWRHDRTTSAMHLLAAGTTPAAIVKVALRAAGADPARVEADMLAALGPAARAAGAAVPAAALLERGTTSAALRLELLPGRPAERLLAATPERADDLLHRLGAWLEAWNRATARAWTLDRARLESWLLGPLARLADALGEPGYPTWLEARWRPLAGQPVPVVACHNDLTMANLLVLPEGRLGVIDWEAAGTEGIPLTDGLYAAVDLVAAQGRYRDRPVAFERCFGSGRPQGAAAALLERLRGAVELPAGYATLAFHACWLHHADNERRKRAPGEPLPFLGYARRAAALRVEL